ncbi:MAG: tRNA (adenosine(37)-N6)-dimethylallyltransferase MiaA [Zetaproteobacteria bacterium]|nr:MAG: tRNA (adenosine(37)-N6)-dimethylallyltransferase MiaA [Zetaproteobacteria bacterium]
MSKEKTWRAVALVGATASGKSRLAMDLCEGTDRLIICCDSVQVYRGLDIGSAKPTEEERRLVRHAMLDCCNLPDRFSAMRWASQALAHIRSENAQGRIPLIVGGSGFYLRALLEGFADIPEESRAVRAMLRLQLREQGIEALYRELCICDPCLAKALQPRDTQRIMRALSVFKSTGIPLSTWQKRPHSKPAVVCPVFVLECPRPVLRERIAERFHAMLDAGWLREVHWLSSFALDEDHPARRAVGYRQLLAYVEGKLSLDEAIRDGITATRRYAKRQGTWFRHQTRGAVFGSAAELVSGLRKALAL